MSVISPNDDDDSLSGIDDDYDDSLYSNSMVVPSSSGLIVCYPLLLLKTRRQVSSAQYSYRNMCRVIIRYEGFRGFYKGFGNYLLGCIIAQAIGAAAFKITKKIVINNNTASTEHEANEFGAAAAIFTLNLSRTPFDIVSRRLMVQGNAVGGVKSIFNFSHINNNTSSSQNYYKNGFDAYRKIMRSNGPRGLCRGFGTSLLSKLISGKFSMDSAEYVVEKLNLGEKEESSNTTESMGVQFWLRHFLAGGVSAILTTPLDTIKTRLQVLDAVDENGQRRPLTFRKTVRNLMNEGGVRAFYKGFVPNWALMFTSFTVFSSYSLYKQRSTKNQDNFN